MRATAREAGAFARAAATGAAVAFLVLLAGTASCGASSDGEQEPEDVRTTGDPCRPAVVPVAGFDRREIQIEHPQEREVYVGNAPDPDLCERMYPREECWDPNPWLCDTDMCVVNGYEGDLVVDPGQGDGIAETEEACGAACGFGGMGDRIVCTCKCDAPAGADPANCDSCPDGLECCRLLWFGPTAGSYCVLAGTCPG